MAADRIEIRDLRVVFRGRRGATDTVAIDDLTITIEPGERVAVIGESGSGKTTLGRVLVGLQKPRSGSVRLGGVPLDYGRRGQRRVLRKAVQMVFQDPRGSLDGLRTILDSVAEPARAQGVRKAEALRLAAAELERVGIPAALHGRLPRAVSGGQCQRVGIARALITQPGVLVCDEPTSALDTLVQAEVLRLLRELTVSRGMTLLMITHDLRVAAELCDRIVVMERGRVVEVLDPVALFEHPAQAFTQQLVAATRFES